MNETVKPSPAYYFEFEGKRYSLGMTPAQLKDLKFSNNAYDIKIRPQKRVRVYMTHKTTGRTIGVMLVNNGDKTCQAKNAEIYGITAKADLSIANGPIKIFPIANSTRGIGMADPVSIATELLGEPHRIIEAHETVEVYEDTRTEEIIEYTEEEYDYDYDFYEEKIEVEVPYEYEETEWVDAKNEWTTNDYHISVSYSGGITGIEFYKVLEEPKKLIPKSVRDVFFKFRSVCCFTTLFSLLGLAGLILGEYTNSILYLQDISGIMLLLGWFSAIFACPIQILKVAGKVVGWAFSIGICAFTIGCVVTTPIGIAVAAALILFLQSAVAIPYYFKTLRYKYI